jgi:hypothetical protein
MACAETKLRSPVSMGYFFFYLLFKFYVFVKTENNRDHRGHDHMVFRFTTTCEI